MEHRGLAMIESTPTRRNSDAAPGTAFRGGGSVIPSRGEMNRLHAAVNNLTLDGGEVLAGPNGLNLYPSRAVLATITSGPSAGVYTGSIYANGIGATATATAASIIVSGLAAGETMAAGATLMVTRIGNHYEGTPSRYNEIETATITAVHQNYLVCTIGGVTLQKVAKPYTLRELPIDPGVTGLPPSGYNVMTHNSIGDSAEYYGYPDIYLGSAASLSATHIARTVNLLIGILIEIRLELLRPLYVVGMELMVRRLPAVVSVYENNDFAANPYPYGNMPATANASWIDLNIDGRSWIEVQDDRITP